MDLLFERENDQWQEVLNHYRDTRKWLKHRPITAGHVLLKHCFPAGYLFNLVQMLHVGTDVSMVSQESC